MSEDIATKIEAYLFEREGWVLAAELEERFDVNERAFRSTGRRPGLCSEFAISGDKGFRHIAHATDAEFSRCYTRLRGHGLGELVHARKLLRKRYAVCTVRASAPVFTFERATGQGVLVL